MRLSGRGRATLVAVTAAALAVTAAGSAVASPGSSSAGARDSSAFDHIFVIMLENHSQSSVIGDPNAPYLTSLAHTYAMADHYYGVTHPSMPNYIASIAGDNFGIQDDNDQNVVNLDRTNLVDQLEAKHISWGAYMDTLPANKLDRFGPVVQRHGRVALRQEAQPVRAVRRRQEQPGPDGQGQGLHRSCGADLNSAARAAVRLDLAQPVQRHARRRLRRGPRPPGDPVPVRQHQGRRQRRGAQAEGRRVRARRGGHHHRTPAPGPSTSAIVIVTDENDFTGNAETGGWENAAGCCDSPYVEAGDPRVSATWPGGTYGGGLIPAIVVTARRSAALRRPHPVQPLLAADHDRGQLAPRAPRPRR